MAEDSKQNILIVDDEPANITILATTLKDSYKIVVARNGEEALKRAKSDNPPDIILLDIMMPGIDGYEVCRRLKEDESTSDIPVVFVTGMSEIGDETKGLECGAVDFITKPISPPIVEARIKTHLGVKENLRIQKEQNRELQELNMIKNKFLGIAAHDLRGPIGTINSFAEIIQESPEDVESNNEFLEIIHRVSGEMLIMINDLLDVSVIESGKFDLRLEAGNFSDLVEFRVNLQEKSAKLKDIKLVRDISPIPEAVYDSNRISQVIDNLISNAIKYSEQGSVVTVACGAKDNEIEVAVKDQGPGLSDEDKLKMFGTFTKLSARPTGTERSTGLGLAIVKKIVEAHKGRIIVDSTLGEGSVFTIYIPLAHS